MIKMRNDSINYRICTAAIILSFLTLMPLPSLAEIEIELGIKGGLSIVGMSHQPWGHSGNLVTYLGDDIYANNIKDKSINKFTFGGFIRLNFTEYFSVQPELNYIEKGTVVEGQAIASVSGIGDVVYNVTEKLTLRCAQIPVLARLDLPIYDRVRIGLFAGPAVSLIFDPKHYHLELTSSGRGISSGLTGEPDIQNGKSFDFAIVFGSDIGMPVFGGRLFCDIRYEIGMLNLFSEHVYTDVSDWSEDSVPEQYPVINIETGKVPKLKSRVFQITAGFSFWLNT